MTQPKVTIVKEGAPVETPSAQIVREAVQETEIKDARGRVLSMRKPGIVARMRLIDMVGPETAMNQPYMMHAIAARWVTAIDGEAVVPPGKKSELEALCQRLDDDGLDAVMSWLTEQFGDEALKTDSKESLKK